MLTYFFTPRLSTSQRHYYSYCFQNPATGTRSGQAYYGNYTLEYRAVGQLHVAVVGYYLTQLTEDRLRGHKYGFNTKERVLGLGPAVLWVPKKGLTLEAKRLVETEAQNRGRGYTGLIHVTYQLTGAKPVPPPMP